MREKLSLTQLDLLKEIGTIGAATAATALADLIATKVEIIVPEVNLVPIETIHNLLGDMDRLFFVLDMEIKGDVLGRIFLLFSPDDARFLASALLGKPKEEIDFNDDLFQSSLKESANILGGSYVSALAEMIHKNILTSVPSLAMDMVGAILDFIFIQIAQFSEEAIFIKTDMKVKGLNLEGLFLFFPATESLNKIFEILLGSKE
ncbi:MAG: chemotaxis protein CheC [Candidatus Omnitrophica bacterium]|nr:chemotaxis protein CheC [Candidatus Omnitrophota bacterium]